MKKLITFLGASKIENTTYKFPDDSLMDGSFFSITLAEKYLDSNSTVYLFVTEKAKEVNLNNFVEKFNQLAEKPALEIVDYVESDTKNLIDKFLAIVNSGDELFVDISNSLRFIPAIVLVSALYAKHLFASKGGLIISGIFHAAFIRGNKVAPVYDLSYLVELTEWLYAVRLFADSGNSRVIADLIKNINSRLYTKKHAEKPKMLSGFSKRLTELSEALALGNIKGIRKHSKAIMDSYNDMLKDEINENIPEVKPLFETMIESYKPIASDTEKISLSKEELESEKSIIKLYMQHKDYQNALLLSREYLINLYMYKNMPNEPIDSLDSREKATNELRNGNDKLASLFNEFSNVRNYFAHCGFKKDDMPKIEKLKRKLKDILEIEID